jgi:hypothetical protein
VSVEALAVVRRGLRNLLAHFGVLPPGKDGPPSIARPDIYEITPDAYVLATETGVFEPLHLNGVEVHAGEPAGRIHFLANPGRAPETLYYRADGIVYVRRQPGQVRPGNVCMVVATPYRGQLP